jgi:plasmid stabilization system protein ParE
MKIIWSPQARDDLFGIYRYIAVDNPGVARALHDRIASRVLSLLKTPQIGRAGRVAGTRELVIAGTSYIDTLSCSRRSPANSSRLSYRPAVAGVF